MIQFSKQYVNSRGVMQFPEGTELGRLEVVGGVLYKWFSAETSGAQQVSL
jgi:hypothetical protein